MVASRGLLQLFREVNPGMLKRRERGKVASLKAVGGGGSGPMAYGEERDNIDGIEGLDVSTLPPTSFSRLLCPTITLSTDSSQRSYSPNISQRSQPPSHAKRPKQKNGPNGKSNQLVDRTPIPRTNGRTSPAMTIPISTSPTRIQIPTPSPERRSRLSERMARSFSSRERRSGLVLINGRGKDGRSRDLVWRRKPRRRGWLRKERRRRLC